MKKKFMEFYKKDPAGVVSAEFCRGGDSEVNFFFSDALDKPIHLGATSEGPWEGWWCGHAHCRKYRGGETVVYYVAAERLKAALSGLTGEKI